MIYVAATTYQSTFRELTKPDGSVEQVEDPLPDGGLVEVESADGVELVIRYGGKSITLSADSASQKPDFAEGLKTYPNAPSSAALWWDSERFNTRGSLGVKFGERPVVSPVSSLFFVGFSGSDIFVVIRERILCAPQHVDYTEVAFWGEEASRPRRWMATKCAALSAVIARNEAKRDMLAHIKPEDSIAALEQQVDLLTQLVIQLAKSAPEAPFWIAMLEDGMRLHTSLKFSDPSTALCKVFEHKASVRALQEKYFSERVELKNG